MERYRYRDELEFIHHHIVLLPTKVQELIKGTHFITSYDPFFLGIPRFTASDERSCEEVCFVTFMYNHPTVVMTREYVYDLKVLIHELGHIACYNAYVEEHGNTPEQVVALNDYAATSYHEAYATAFQSFLTRQVPSECYGYHTWEELFKNDIDTYRYFEKQFCISPHLIYPNGC